MSFSLWIGGFRFLEPREAGASGASGARIVEASTSMIWGLERPEIRKLLGARIFFFCSEKKNEKNYGLWLAELKVTVWLLPLVGSNNLQLIGSTDRFDI